MRTPTAHLKNEKNTMEDHSTDMKLTSDHDNTTTNTKIQITFTKTKNKFMLNHFNE